MSIKYFMVSILTINSATKGVFLYESYSYWLERRKNESSRIQI